MYSMARRNDDLAGGLGEGHADGWSWGRPELPLNTTEAAPCGFRQIPRDDNRRIWFFLLSGGGSFRGETFDA